jgi:hypothetical protein
MTPIPFGELMNWILEERKQGSVFGIRRPMSRQRAKCSTSSPNIWRRRSARLQARKRSFRKT